MEENTPPESSGYRMPARGNRITLGDLIAAEESGSELSEEMKAAKDHMTKAFARLDWEAVVKNMVPLRKATEAMVSAIALKSSSVFPILPAAEATLPVLALPPHESVELREIRKLRREVQQLREENQELRLRVVKIDHRTERWDEEMRDL